jgi:hypothetical protein
MDDVYSIYIRKLFYYFNMVGVTYSWYVRSEDASFKYLYSCEPPICASCSAGFTYVTFDPVEYPASIPYKSSTNGVSCSLYTFIATQNNTIVNIESCSELKPPATEPYTFTHSLIFRLGEVGFICSTIFPTLVTGSYSNLSVTNQPSSPCDCGRNYTTTTTTTSSTTIVSLTQSWLSRRNCCPSTGPATYTYSNFPVNDFPTLGIPLPSKSWVQVVGGEKFCWKLIGNVGFSASYRKHTETLYNDCSDCLTTNSITCPTTTTTSTTTTFQQPPPGTSNCPCGSFECVNYVIQGDVGDSIRWRECTISINTSPIRAFFNFYYFYEQETISICSCSANLLVVSGVPIINGNQWPQSPGQGDICSKKTSNCEVCKSFFVELGESLRTETRPILVEYESCYAPYGGHQHPNKMMWPVTGGVTFSGLPVPLPIWAPTPMSGTIYGRKTHLYQICSCGNTKFPDDSSNFYSPTISFWNGAGSVWVQSPRSLTQSSAYLDEVQHFIWQACNHGTCSCYSYSNCTTSTTTMGPCVDCIPTVIGASGPGYTNITYEGCDTIVKHNIKTDFLFTGNTSSICACQRCRSWKVRPIQGADSFPYVHCCDSVFSAANYNPPPWHSSTVYNLYPQTCRNYTLTSGGGSWFSYIGCEGSKIYYTQVQTGTPQYICAATISWLSDSNPNFDISGATACGTASVDICVSRHYYGNLSPDHASFGLITPGVFTFSSLGSCSCITSDNRYKNNTYFNYSFPGPELEYLSVTFSSSATCSDKIIPIVTPPSPQIPPCCNCKSYYFYNYSPGDIVVYKPCDSNRLNTSQVSLSLPQINMQGTTNSTGSFSVVVRGTGFWGVGAISAIFNHNNLVYYSHTINPSLSSPSFLSSGSYSRLTWNSTSGVNLGNADIITITFAAVSSARLTWVDNLVDNTEVADIIANDMNAQLNSGWVKFPGINLPAEESFTGSGNSIVWGGGSNPTSANTIFGNLLYLGNQGLIPMNDTLVQILGTYGVSNRYTGFSYSGNLIPAGAVLMASSTTDSTGRFSFSVSTGFNLSASYSLRIVNTKPWGGVNSTDALLIQRHFNSIQLLSTRLRQRAADTNNSGSINSTDALQVSNRITNITNSFTSGDFASDIIDGNDGVTTPIASINWFIPNNLVGNSSQGWSMSVRVLCIGDVNGSHQLPA